MNLFSIAQCINSHNNSKLYRLSLIFFLTYSNFLIILCLYFILSYILTLYKTQMTPCYMLHSVGKGNDIYATCSEKEKENTMHLLILASRSNPYWRVDVCVSTQLTGANQAPIVACRVSRSFRVHHIDAALGLESDGMLCARAWYWCGWTSVYCYVAGLRVCLVVA